MKPEYTIYPEDIIVLFRSNATNKKQNLKGGTLDGTLDDKQKRIIMLLLEKPEITQTDISEKLSCSLRQAKRMMKELADIGYIKRVGGRRFGHWEIVNK